MSLHTQEREDRSAKTNALLMDGTNIMSTKHVYLGASSLTIVPSTHRSVHHETDIYVTRKIGYSFNTCDETLKLEVPASKYRRDRFLH